MKKIAFIIVIICLLISCLAINDTNNSSLQSQGESTQQNNMVRIPGGTFTMGSPVTEVRRDSGEIQRQVTLSSFQISKYPVTQREYQEIMGQNPSHFKGENLPVENVSWYNAIEYCNRLSIKEGLTPAYSLLDNTNPDGWNINFGIGTAVDTIIVADSNGYRLPTEAQWEYACRAGTTTPFNTGRNITTRQANYDGNGPYNNNRIGEYRERTTPVGSFPANAWGLYDMHGNVSEWCWDWYGNYPSEAQTDPTGVNLFARGKVYRGGCWLSYGSSLRSAYRGYGRLPYWQDRYLGFRVVRP